MHRRTFNRTLTGTALGLAGALLQTPTARAQYALTEGTHYLRLKSRAPVTLPAGKKLEVIEFFWYECPHCHALEPLLEPWLRRLPEDVAFRRVPVGFSARHAVAQKMFYALQEMGLIEAMHRKVFAAIHEQGLRLLAERELVAFMTANGVDGTRFSELFRSFQVATRATQARQLSDAYEIDGVPSIGIDGRYVTSGPMAGSHERMLAVVNQLITLARQA